MVDVGVVPNGQELIAAVMGDEDFDCGYVSSLGSKLRETVDLVADTEVGNVRTLDLDVALEAACGDFNFMVLELFFRINCGILISMCCLRSSC